MFPPGAWHHHATPCHLVPCHAMPPLHFVLVRDALIQLFDIIGLESRGGGPEGDTGYTLPDRGAKHSEAVVKKVRSMSDPSPVDNICRDTSLDLRQLDATSVEVLIASLTSLCD